MSLKGALCVPLGHRYHPARTDTPYPVLECERCGHVMEMTAESSDGESWTARGARSEAASLQMMDPKVRR